MPNVADVVNRTLEELAVLPLGQSPTGEDYQIVESTYIALYSELLSEGIVTWNDESQIPEYAVFSMAVLCANRLSRAFGLSEERRSQLRFDAEGQGNSESAKNKLRKIATRGDVEVSGSPPVYF